MRTSGLAGNGDGASSDRFVLIDISRTLAAFIVVIWHWQHFFFVGDRLPVGFDRSIQPFYSVLAPFYLQGGIAVNFFFIVSGFIFFWKYEQSIGCGETSSWRFAVARFSRLYPLHLLTLIVVIGLQLIHISIVGQPFANPDLDLYALLPQLLLATDWGFDVGRAFNLPAWSISCEIVAYFAFFLVVRYRLNSFRWVVTYALVGLVAMASVRGEIADVLYCFFIGGLIAKLYRRTQEANSLAFLLLSLSAFLLGLVLVDLNLDGPAFRPVASMMVSALTTIIPPLSALSSKLIGRLTEISVYLQFSLLLFPGFIGLCASGSRFLAPLIRPLAPFGNLSYAVYLWHFPLQILCVLTLPALVDSGAGSLYARPSVLILFLVVLTGVSWLSFACYEMPLQRFLRVRLQRRAPPHASLTALAEMERL